MSGIVTLKASMKVSGIDGDEWPFDVAFQVSATKWVSRATTVIAANTYMVNFTTAYSTILALLLMADQPLTVYLGGSSAPGLPLPAYAPMLIPGAAAAVPGGGYLGGIGSPTSGIYLTNANSDAATIVYSVAGV